MISPKVSQVSKELVRKGFCQELFPKDDDFIIGCNFASDKEVSVFDFLANIEGIHGDFYQRSKKEGLSTPQLIFYLEDQEFCMRFEAYLPPSGKILVLLYKTITKKEMFKIIKHGRDKGVEFYGVHGP